MSLSQTDSYKLSHRGFMVPDTELVYSNMTARSSKYLPVLKDRFDEKVVWFGMQHVIQDYLIEEWNRNFFNKPKKTVIKKYQRLFDNYLGKGAISMKHFEELHDYGRLPISILSHPEGTLVPIGVPLFIIENTDPRFAWLTNYLETSLSAELWKPSTVATIIRQYRLLVNDYAMETVGNIQGTEFQVHDFSFRGMSGRRDAAFCGAGFLLSSCGTDTVPAIEFLEDYYGADSGKEFIATSVPASEHSLASAGIAVHGELETYRKWITKDYPSGIVSIISDTLDFFEVITTMATKLKNDILNRVPNELGLAKVVFRPDSGCPVKILTGYKTDGMEFANVKDAREYYNKQSFSVPEAVKVDGEWLLTRLDEYANVQFVCRLSDAQVRGAVQCLWDIFGGTETEKGYKLLHERVGLIYGDSITLERANQIMQRLKEKGFASTNCVFGVGSYTSQYITRDSLGMAVKATATQVAGVPYPLFKDPITDDGTKKSARGFLSVVRNEYGELELIQEADEVDLVRCVLVPVFSDGRIVTENMTTLSEIRERLWGRC